MLEIKLFRDMSNTWRNLPYAERMKQISAWTRLRYKHN